MTTKAAETNETTTRAVILTRVSVEVVEWVWGVGGAAPGTWPPKMLI